MMIDGTRDLLSMLAGGQEVIVGAVTDGSFGKLVAFGLGGVPIRLRFRPKQSRGGGR